MQKQSQYCYEEQPNQTLQATAVKRLGWQVGCQRSAVPELIVRRGGHAGFTEGLFNHGFR
jgi:hypothetical protein